VIPCENLFQSTIRRASRYDISQEWYLTTVTFEEITVPFLYAITITIAIIMIIMWWNLYSATEVTVVTI
jgi:hypothetical protein